MTSQGTRHHHAAVPSALAYYSEHITDATVREITCNNISVVFSETFLYFTFHRNLPRDVLFYDRYLHAVL
jgi:hypothetical protein